MAIAVVNPKVEWLRDGYLRSYGRDADGRASDLHRYVLAYDDEHGLVYESEDIRKVPQP